MRTLAGRQNLAAPRSGFPLDTDRGAPGLFLFLIVFAATSFNMALCFANTNIGGVGNGHIIVCEILIVSAVLLFCLRWIDETLLLLIGSLVLYTLVLAFVRFAVLGQSGIDVKPARDFLIPITFFLLGTRAKDIGTLDRIVGVTTLIVLAVALFEYFFADLYTRTFNVAAYFVSRGAMEAKQAIDTGDLFISGMRPAGGGGRNLLPILGDHRVSSIFLEPISSANFGIIVFLWGLMRSRVEGTLKLAILIPALVLVILSDSRFGAYFCIVSIALVFLPARSGRLAMVAAPFAALTVLLLLPVWLQTDNLGFGDNLIGRLVLSGSIISSFNGLAWFGLEDAPVKTFDSGYGYIINAIGLVAAAVAWLLFLRLERPGRQFNMFRNMAAAYYAAILCVSNSPFTIKTAALLWFLLGALYQLESPPYGSPQGVARNARANRYLRQGRPC
jgi:putative polymerase